MRRILLRTLSVSASLCVVVAVYFLGAEIIGSKNSVAATNRSLALPPLNTGGPEAQLDEIFKRIEQNKMEAALQQAEALTEKYPSFRLGHLLKGDLLLARVQPLSTIGNAANGPKDKLSDLRDEAIARINAYRTKPPEDGVPSYLLQMLPEQKFAVVVDTLRSRLYLFENNNGTPKLVTDYYITQGKLGSEKSREGDKRTPIGVYHVTSNLPRQKLGDFYGSGAYPINYPNDWDKRQGRDGHGIWLHGTPSDTYSRPPKASDGCVVLSNQDLDALAQNLQIGLTPVIISKGVQWVSPKELKSEREGLLAEFEQWRKDWESRDGDRYATHYSRTFNADGLDYNAWTEQKRKVNAGKEWIKIGATEMTAFRYPGKEEMAVITFQQDYQSNNLTNVMKKRQYWIKEDGRWKIIFEGAA